MYDNKQTGILSQSAAAQTMLAPVDKMDYRTRRTISRLMGTLHSMEIEWTQPIR